jgi:hypothetical protein
MSETRGFSGKYDLDPHHWQGGAFGKQIYEFTNNRRNPLTCQFGLTLYRPDHHFFTDLGSIPLWLQTKLPKYFAKDRYPLSYLFHDSAYRHKGVWIFANGVWEFRSVTRKQADELLYEMLLIEGASKLNAKLIYTGVRLGGWASWGRKPE